MVSVGRVRLKTIFLGSELKGTMRNASHTTSRVHTFLIAWRETPVRPPSAAMHSYGKRQGMRRKRVSTPLTATISFHGGWLPAAAPAFAFVAVAFLAVDLGFASFFFVAFLVVFASAFLVSAFALVAFARADGFLFVAPSSSSASSS